MKRFAFVASLICLAARKSSAFSPSSASRPSLEIRSAKQQRNPAQFVVQPTTTSLAAAALEVIPPSYELAIGTLALASAFGLPQSPLKNKLTAFVAGIPLAIFAAFLFFQTTNLRFTFDDKNFSLVKSDMSSLGENVVVGGENVWAYDKFVNYDFFPSEKFPILVYFKETQTPEEFWNVGPGEQANSEAALAKGAQRGQVHFFPAVGNVEKLREAFETHGCAKISK